MRTPARNRTLGILPAALAVAAVLSCSESTARKTGGVPASLVVVAGQDQSGVVGKELAEPLRVQVLDANGDPVRGQVVNFRVTSGGGSVFAGVAITTENGIAVDRWTLGTKVSESQRVEARAVDPNTGEPLVFGTFQATPLPDVAAQLAKAEGDAQSGVAGAALPTPLGVKVSDQYGNPVPGVTVTWAVAAGDGTLSASATQTDALGVARVSWTLGPAAGVPQQVSASAGTPPPVIFDATTTAGAPTQLNIQTAAAGAVVNVPFATQPVIRIADANGNTVTGSTAVVTISVSPVATVIGTASANAVQGVASFVNAGLDGAVGTHTLTYAATIDGTVRTVTQPIELVAGPPTKYILTGNANVAISGSITISAQLSDANNAPVATSGGTVTWTSTGVPGTFGAATSVTDASGVATVGFTAGTVAGEVTIRATDESGVAGSHTVTVTPGPAVKLGFVTQPTNTGWRVVFPSAPRVAAEDAYSNVVTTVTGRDVTLALAMNPAGASLAGSAVATMTNGVATFDAVYLTEAGSGFSLRAMSAGLTETTSQSFDVSQTAIVTLVPALPSGSRAPGGLTIAGGRVYFASGYPTPSPSQFKGGSAGGMWSVPTTGGTPGAIAPASNSAFWFSGYSGRVTSDATAVYVLTLGTGIQRIPLSGAPTSSIRTGGGGEYFTARDMVVSGDYAYVSYGIVRNDSRGSSLGVERVSLSDGAGSWLYSLAVDDVRCGPPAMVVTSSSMYYTAFERPSGSLWIGVCPSVVGIEQVPVTGGAFSTVGPASPAPGGPRWGRMATDGVRLFYVEGSDLRSMPITGGAATTHATGLAADAGNMVVSDGFLYLNNDGGLERYRLTDFAMTHIADDVVDIAVDAVAVYWTSAGANPSVKKAPK
jgi:hypothetical protein